MQGCCDREKWGCWIWGCQDVRICGCWHARILGMLEYRVVKRLKFWDARMIGDLKIQLAYTVGLKASQPLTSTVTNGWYLGVKTILIVVISSWTTFHIL